MRCPGQDPRFWGPDAVYEIPCHACGWEVEFWKDEPKRRCRKCGAMVRNPKIDTSCARWCKFASACLGYVPGEDGESPSDEPVVARLMEAMKTASAGDAARIERCLDILEHAEALLVDSGGNPMVVVAAAVLYELGPEGARAAAAGVGLDEPTIERVVGIVSGSDDSPEAKLVADAVRQSAARPRRGGVEGADSEGDPAPRKEPAGREQ